MKQLIKLFSFSLLLAATFSACTKDENQIFYEGGTAPVLTASSTAPLVLDINNKTANAIGFSWTNPNYQLTTGISSQDVSYTLQIDTANANFKGSKIQEIAISKNLSTSLTVKDLNTSLLTLGLTEAIVGSVEIRIKSSLANNSAALYSNVIKLNVTPYLDTKFAVPTALYITGSATPLSWQCGCASDGAGTTQKFTKISSTVFQLTVTLTGGQSYLLLPVYGSWSAKYGGVAAGNANNVFGDDFQPNGNDLLAPPATKSYKVTVDFKTGKFTVL